MKEFKYNTTTETKRVVMGETSNGYFVDVYPQFGMHTSNRYTTEKEALKRFNTIKNRVTNKNN